MSFLVAQVDRASTHNETNKTPNGPSETNHSCLHAQALAKELNWGLHGGQNQISELAVKAGATLK